MVKIAANRVDGFVARPDPGIHAALIYGGDSGLVRERADRLAHSVVADPTDPFAVTELTSDDLKGGPAALVDGAAALPFSGGRGLVRLRSASDTVSSAAEALFQSFTESDGGASFVLIEAGELPPRSKLRQAFERAKTGAALPCYADDASSLPALIVDHCRRAGFQIDRDAVDYLAHHLGSDRGVTRSELDKLVLYMGGNGEEGNTPSVAPTVALADAMACVGDSGATSVDAVVAAVAGGQRGALEAALARTRVEGVAPVQLVRAVASHFQRLHLAMGWIDRGLSPEDAMGKLRPPVFFKAKGDFRRQIGAWSLEGLARVLMITAEAEADCKTTGLPDIAVAERAMLRISQAARSR